ncbi:MAG: hypothetical protein ACRELU_12850 [Gemmatimonadota bacterium]
MRGRWLAWLLVALTACGGPASDGPGEAAPVSGRPPDRPLLSRDAVRLEPVLRLSDPARLAQPRDLTVDEAGNVYVLDFAPPSGILKYGPEGEFLLRFGTREEEERIVSGIEMDLTPWRTVLVIDRGRNTLNSYLVIGTFALSVEVKPAVALDVLGLPEFGEFYLHKWDTEGQRSVVLHMRAPYDSLATTYEVRVPVAASLRDEARAVHYHTAVDRQGRLYVGFYDGYPVRVLEPGGRTVRMIDLDRERLRKSAAELRREEEDNLARLHEQAPAMDEELLREAARPDSLWPLLEELAVDPTGRLWVRTRRPDSGRATSYDVFNEQGEYLVRVDVPGRVERTTFAPDGRLFTIVAGEDEEREIVGYRVGFGAPGPSDEPERTAAQPTSESGT